MTKSEMNAADILDAAADTYRERNKLYGDNYKHFGAACVAMFPHGLTLRTAGDWNRLGVFIQATSKLTRYAQNFSRGGHIDSAHDLSVYAAMLQELTELPAPQRAAPMDKDVYNDGWQDGARAVLQALRRKPIGGVIYRPTGDELADEIATELEVEL